MRDEEAAAPRPSSLKKYLPVFMTACIGIIASFWLYSAARNWDKQKLRLEFEIAAKDRLSAINRGFEAGRHSVESLEAFYAASKKVERSEFGRFTHHLFQTNPGIQALEWIPHVSEYERAFYEENARNEGFPEFQITQRESQRKMVRAGQAKEYFPVYYVEPYKGNELALGFDLFSDPIRRDSIYKSRDIGQMVASGPIRLVQETGDKSGFLLFMPIFKINSPADTPEGRRKNLEGFVLGVFHIRDIVENALTFLEPRGVDIYIFDESGPENNKLLYFHPSRMRKEPIPPAARDASKLTEGLYYAAPIHIPYREWLIVFRPTQAYVSAATTLQPLGVLFSGLLFTGLAAIFLLTNISRATELAESNTRLHREIEERKRAEESLKESEKQYRTVVDSSLTGICILQDGEYQFVNRRFAEMSGYSAEELTGTSFRKLIHPDDIGLAQEILVRRLTGENTGGIYQLRAINKSGETRWIQTLGAVIEHESNPAILINVMDITDRKLAEEERQKLETQLQHAQKLESLGVLAGGIAHDFNNLLTGILGNAQLALMGLSPVSPARERIQEIEKASERAAELCNQMLAYSGRGRFVIDKIDINEIIDEMTHLLEVSIAKNAVLKFNLAENLPAIEADVTQIRQIVMNLITNASEAIEDKSGIISISTGAMECDRAYLSNTYINEDIPEGVYTYMEISDTGCGMEPETLNKIFEPFFTTKFTGRGLGLAAVIGIVRGHKGAIKIYTEPDKGTTFKVLFPGLTGMAEPRVHEDAEDSRWQGDGLALLVDDEETVRTIGKSMLEIGGFKVLLASDGSEAVDIFKKYSDEIVIVLLDMTMPHMGGEDAFREIRRIRDDARVILCSGYNEQEVTSRFVGKGLAGFIQKPYRYEVLIEKIRKALEA